MILLKTNELNNKTKKTMKERVISSLFIVSFFVILFILGWLSDNVNNWSPLNSLTERRVFAWLLLLYILPTIFIFCKEVNNIYFRYNYITLFLLFFCACSLIYAPTLIYFLKYYHYWNDLQVGTSISQLNTITNIFAITLAIAIFATVIINTLLLWFYNLLTIKNWFILNLFIGVTSGFYLGSCFFLFTRGFLSLIWLMFIVFACDTFSYFGGLFFGKHKMAKKISPKKTWEGFFVGQALTILVSMLMLYGFSFINHTPNVLMQIMGVQFKPINDEITVSPSLWWVSMFFIIMLLSVISVLGDLTYSWFKRKYRIKDYGVLIPGHGGIMDRIDSHSVVISTYFVLSFFIALFAKTVVFFEPINGLF